MSILGLLTTLLKNPDLDEKDKYELEIKSLISLLQLIRSHDFRRKENINLNSEIQDVVDGMTSEINNMFLKVGVDITSIVDRTINIDVNNNNIRNQFIELLPPTLR